MLQQNKCTLQKKAINGAAIGHLKDKCDSIKTASSLD